MLIPSDESQSRLRSNGIWAIVAGYVVFVAVIIISYGFVQYQIAHKVGTLQSSSLMELPNSYQVKAIYKITSVTKVDDRGYVTIKSEDSQYVCCLSQEMDLHVSQEMANVLTPDSTVLVTIDFPGK